MHTVADVARFLEEFAPAALAESWDNVGLLVGRLEQPVARVMTCLTITPDSAREAVAQRADLIVTHHPLPFRPLARLTDQSSDGRLLLELIEAKIAIFSPHTAFDSAQQGINQRLAAGLQLSAIAPIVPAPEPGQGAGRRGRLSQPTSLAQLAQRVKSLLAIEHVQIVGAPDRTVHIGRRCLRQRGRILGSGASGRLRLPGDRRGAVSRLSRGRVAGHGADPGRTFCQRAIRRRRAGRCPVAEISGLARLGQRARKRSVTLAVGLQAGVASSIHPSSTAARVAARIWPAAVYNGKARRDWHAVS